ncbi:Glutamine synthetase/guanido kinase, catalytic domain,Glutamine synthetase, catalytic domain,Glutamine [Cinara cedri]|uniref:Lengsin n=1 Tax=Cinara cedri TaxID=506608 RepID=A0A5E4N5S3_9HEMI|nr:Glutamine synthetase/guanido kinase, catalytic domain,Glutamine synthetase, catalytic domain,Glutamine [Cinara cedri]
MSDLVKFLEQNPVNFIDFRFTDLIGKVHSTTYNADRLAENKIDLVPDLQTIFLDPFCVQSTAVVLCMHDSRSVAKKAYDYALSTKTVDEVLCSFEIGFSIFDEVQFRVNQYNSHASLSPVENYLSIKKHNHGSFDSNPVIDPLSDLRSEILLMMKESGIENSLYHKKISPFQGLIRVDSSRLLKCADSVQKSKYIIRNVAQSYGKTATFMPKAIAQNSLYLHQSLLKNNEDLLENPENYLCYMGGIMKHMKAINAYSNPTTNSYSRLIDLPNLFLQSKLSFPDPTANPYFCFAAILMAGLDGIQNKVNLYEIEKQTARSLIEALEMLSNDREFLLRGDVFTNEQIDNYIEKKCEEIKIIEMAIHPAEFICYYNL